jgi:hypothetical protein
MDPEAHDEPHDAAQHTRRNRTYRCPPQGQRPCAEWRISHCPDGTSTPAGLGHRTVPFLSAEGSWSVRQGQRRSRAPALVGGATALSEFATLMMIAEEKGTPGALLLLTLSLYGFKSQA